MPEMFVEITLIAFVAAILSYIFRLFKQPAILAYVLTGVLIGPFAHMELVSGNVLQTFAQLGITFLLFMLGLEFRVRDLLTIGKSAFAIAVLQMLLSFGAGWLLATLLGFSPQALLIGVAVMFSSTIIVLQLLSEKKDLRSLYGRIAAAMLLVQDFAAVFVLMILSTSVTPDGLQTDLVGLLFVKALVLFLLVVIVSKTIFPFITRRLAISDDSLVLFSLAWLFGFCLFVASGVVGFPIEIGGFLAGLALGQGDENVHIAAKTRVLRDVFIIFFFVLLGMNISFTNIAGSLAFSLPLILLVVIGKPFLTAVSMALFRFRIRTAVITDLHMGQISEFSLIVLYLALAKGLVDANIVSTMTFVSIVSFVISSYIILHADRIYAVLRPVLSRIDRGDGHESAYGRKSGDFDTLKNHVVLVGAHRIGQSILEALLQEGERVVVVDFDPNVVKYITDEQVTVLFGDITDAEIQEKIQLLKAKLVVSTVPDLSDNLVLIGFLKKHNPKSILHIEMFALIALAVVNDFTISQHTINIHC